MPNHRISYFPSDSRSERINKHQKAVIERPPKELKKERELADDRQNVVREKREEIQTFAMRVNKPCTFCTNSAKEQVACAHVGDRFQCKDHLSFCWPCHGASGMQTDSEFFLFIALAHAKTLCYSRWSGRGMCSRISMLDARNNFTFL